MISANTLSTSLSKAVSHLFGPTQRRERSKSTEIEARFARFVAERSELDGSLFDRHFMRTTGNAIAAQFVTGTLPRSHAASALAAAWDRAVGPAAVDVRKRRIAAMTELADAFLATLRPVVEAPAQATATAVMVRSASATGEPVLAVMGALDAAHCDEIIREAAALHAGGATGITLDLSHVHHISLCGIYALHAIAAVFGHAACPDAFSSGETSLQALRRLAEANLAGGRVDGIGIICPDAAVDAKLRSVGLDQVYQLSQ